MVPGSDKQFHDLAFVQDSVGHVNGRQEGTDYLEINPTQVSLPSFSDLVATSLECTGSQWEEPAFWALPEDQYVVNPQDIALPTEPDNGKQESRRLTSISARPLSDWVIDPGYCDEIVWRGVQPSSIASESGSESPLWSYNGQGKHVCKVCRISFGKAYDLKSHAVKYAHKTYECGRCPNVYTRPDSVARHIAKQHDRFKPQRCPFCYDPQIQRVFNRRDHLERHIRDEHSSSSRRCDTSINVFETKSEKEQKMRSWMLQTRASLGSEHPAVKSFDEKCGSDSDKFPDHFRDLLKAWVSEDCNAVTEAE